MGEGSCIDMMWDTNNVRPIEVPWSVCVADGCIMVVLTGIEQSFISAPYRLVVLEVGCLAGGKVDSIVLVG